MGRSLYADAGRWALVSAALLVLVACGSLGSSTTPEVCDGIGADMGGCAEDLPSFTAEVSVWEAT